MKSGLNDSDDEVGSKQYKWVKLVLSALIPIMIATFTTVNTISQNRISAQKREQEQHDALLLRQQSERQAENLQRETIFATYLNDITQLLLLDDQMKSLIYIRTKTLTALRQLDPERKKYALLFLLESELIFRDPSSSLSKLLNLQGADFNGIAIRGSVDSQCSFTRLYLPGALISNSTFTQCYIDRSNFSSSIMYRAVLTHTLITRTWFKFAFLDRTSFSDSKLYYAYFMGASLAYCDFTGAVWHNGTVDFTSANLSGAILSTEQLANSTLYNCVLPDGSWGPIKTGNLVVNGNAGRNCTVNGSDIVSGWIVDKSSDIDILAYTAQTNNETFGTCYFRVTSFFETRKVASMRQLANLEEFALLITSEQARYRASANFQCFGRQYASMELRFIDLHGLRYEGIYKGTGDGTDVQAVHLSDMVRPDVRSVEILITFVTPDRSNGSNAHLSDNYCIGDNVKFSILKA